MQVQVLKKAHAAVIAAWRYPGRYATYEFDDPSALETDHWAVTEAGELLGYCCFGAPARVPGAEPEPGTLDVGYGMAPDRMGVGYGHRFIAAILDFALERHDAARFRLYVLEWNERSRRTAARHGFAIESRWENEKGTFLLMVRAARN